MAEKLCELKKKGGGSFTFSVIAYGNNAVEQYGKAEIPSQNLYHKLKIVSYINLSYTGSNFPRIVIDGTTYNRPAVGTEFDITNKSTIIESYASTNGWKKTGVTVELL